MLLFRLYFWSHPPMMLLYMKVGFIPGEILDAFYWPLLFVMDQCPVWNAQYTEITFFWWFLDWLVVSILATGKWSPPSQKIVNAASGTLDRASEGLARSKSIALWGVRLESRFT